MLKKLAKYGNSTTLIIDKAILELLNMNESSIVKLKIEGPSLIITPMSEAKGHEKISYTASEATRAADQAIRKKLQKPVSGQLKKEQDKTFSNLQKEFQLLFKKHNYIFERFHDESFMGPKFQEAIEDITQTIDPSKDPETFCKEVSKVNKQFHPELADFHKDMVAIVKKHSPLKKLS